jgi:hypothetical protein
VFKPRKKLLVEESLSIFDTRTFQDVEKASHPCWIIMRLDEFALMEKGYE